jgi:hypothetical protein
MELRTRAEAPEEDPAHDRRARSAERPGPRLSPDDRTLESESRPHVCPSP